MKASDSTALCKILVIDDDENVRAWITKFLTKTGFQPLLAINGKEGVALAARHRPELILCDLEMPEMDGYQVLAELRRSPELAATPIIFLTGRSEPAQVRFGMNLGADDYLTKPVGGEDLLSAIRARLNLVRVRQRSRSAADGDLNERLDQTFLVKTATEKRLVKIREITRIVADGEYSWVYWEKGQGALLRKSLKQWLMELPREQFIRVHRGAIVNLAYLERIERRPGGKLQIRLRESPEPIDVSLRLAPALNRKLHTLHLSQQPG